MSSEKKAFDITIVIPVYNIEDYIDECFNSINTLFSSKLRFEIIFVNDGSTDLSMNKCLEISRKFQNVKLINKSNGGLSSARNEGLKYSKGDYVWFVDGDDFILNSRTLLSSLDLLVKSKIDALNFNITKFSIKSNNLASKNMRELKSMIIHEDVFTFLLKNSILPDNSVVNVIKKSVLTDNNICFKENMYSEDLDWVLEVYSHVKNLIIDEQSHYAYRIDRADSITHLHSLKNVTDPLVTIDKWVKLSNPDDRNNDLILNHLAFLYSTLFVHIPNKASKQDYTLAKNKLVEHDYLLKYDKNTRVKM